MAQAAYCTNANQAARLQGSSGGRPCTIFACVIVAFIPVRHASMHVESPRQLQMVPSATCQSSEFYQG